MSSSQSSSPPPPPTSNNPNLVQQDGIWYQTGFGNELQSECLPGALPVGRNNPRQVPYGLYAEQLSGTAFTAPRAQNQRVWLYRVQPRVVVGMSSSSGTTSNDDADDDNNRNDFDEEDTNETYFGGCAPHTCQTAVDPLRWRPLDSATSNNTISNDQQQQQQQQHQGFVQGMKLVCCAGDPSTKSGLAMYMYACGGGNQSSSSSSSSSTNDSTTHLMNADGDFLIVPQQGSLKIVTEMGVLQIAPTQIAVIPRGIVFSVHLLEAEATRGYVLEVYNGHFQLPELGPIGSNGLVNARDVHYPTAQCAFTNQQDYQQPCTIQVKMHSKLHSKPSPHSPYNVVAWHGTYLPFRYDLKRFCAVNSVTYDHLDPSIYTVLTCPSNETGTALADFVLFPPRILATDSNTLRPPWFHRNTMSEFMGLIYGEYDAKTSGDNRTAGFVPGGASLHNCMVPHGPDAASYDKAVADECKEPVKFAKGMAFMFETCLSLKVAPNAMEDVSWREMGYCECWQDLTADNFTGWSLLEKQNTEE